MAVLKVEKAPSRASRAPGLPLSKAEPVESVAEMGGNGQTAPAADLAPEQEDRGGVASAVTRGSEPRGNSYGDGAAPTRDPRGSLPLPRPDRLLTADDVAEILGVPRSYVYALARRGELPTVRVGDRYVRFRCRSLQRWIEDCETTEQRGTQ